MEINLENNNKQIMFVKFKEGKAKDDFKEGKGYYLEVEDATNFPSGNRRINIYDDYSQYYYPRDGVQFKEDFEIIDIMKQQGGKPKTLRKRKNLRKNKLRKTRRKSNRRRR